VVGGGTAARLAEFLRAWLGQWPPAGSLSVVGYGERTRPGWDGAVYDAVGVAGPAGAVVSVPPDRVEAVRAVAADWAGLPRVLPAALGRPEAGPYLGRFRWCERPNALADVGEWLPVTDPRVPPWLHPFGGQALVVLTDGRYAAGVGLKRHNRYGWELAVGTDPAHRGRGLAAGLCAQAARRVIAIGAVPIYLYDPANVASARTATAAGFVDEGWHVLGMTPVDAEEQGPP
jgi:RimJ/RimL family protein N-acetyltransferase